jgi:hypothetical protein
LNIGTLSIGEILLLRFKLSLGISFLKLLSIVIPCL